MATQQNRHGNGDSGHDVQRHTRHALRPNVQLRQNDA